MPQINQLMLAYASQWFWLAVVLAVIYFVIGRGMLPKIEATVDARDGKIAADLAAAHKARADAEEAETALQAKDAANRVAKADVEIAAKLATADAALSKARAKALASVEEVATDAAQDIVAKVSGMKVTAAGAAKAVKAVLANG
jgi:F-type H+-transporting ATPase subunit b